MSCRLDHKIIRVPPHIILLFACSRSERDGGSTQHLHRQYHLKTRFHPDRHLTLGRPRVARMASQDHHDWTMHRAPLRSWDHDPCRPLRKSDWTPALVGSRSRRGIDTACTRSDSRQPSRGIDQRRLHQAPSVSDWSHHSETELPYSGGITVCC